MIDEVSIGTLPTKPLSDGSGADFGFEAECVQFFEEIVQILGVPRSVGQIYGLLFASPEPLSFSDILERLRISKGSVSQGLQLLRTLGAVQEVITESDRRLRFVPELALRKLFVGVLREKVEPFVGEGSARVERLRELALEAGTGVGGKFARSRVDQIEVWRRQMHLVLPLLKTFLG
jgi:DNA-binding transcriptional regulator GbsR (MarR family)